MTQVVHASCICSCNRFGSCSCGGHVLLRTCVGPDLPNLVNREQRGESHQLCEVAFMQASRHGNGALALASIIHELLTSS
jgi:hypothetical protein